MTRAKTDLPLTPPEAKKKALSRVLARRRPPKYAEIPDVRTGGVFRYQVDPGGDFAPPRDLDEWVDDRVARCALGPSPCGTLIEVLEACRDGVDAVPAAVALARPLSKSDQFGVWMVLNALPGGPAPVGAVKAAIGREWQAAGLAVTPHPVAGREPIDRHAPSRAARSVKYRSEYGQPAGLAV